MKRTKRECYIGEDGYCHVPLANGKGEAICDAEFIDEINKHSWIFDNNRVVSRIIGKTISIHKFLFYLKGKAKLNDFFEITHINKNKFDNRMSNLESNKRDCYIKDGICVIPLQNGQEAICDKEYISELNKYNWTKDNRGYVRTRINNRAVFLHHFVFILKFKKIKDGFLLDHIDRRKLNNLTSNLREATKQQNSMNRSKKTNHFKGVSFKKKTGKYDSCITLDRKYIHLGSFLNSNKAAYAYDVAAYHYFKEFAVLNFPENIEKYKKETPGHLTYKKTTASSNFIGVYFCKRKQKFIAVININKKIKYIGSFEDAVSAARARDAYIVKNNLNRKLNFLITYQHELNQEPKNMVLFKAN